MILEDIDYATAPNCIEIFIDFDMSVNSSTPEHASECEQLLKLVQ